MFEHNVARGASTDLMQLFASVWGDLAAPGTGWSGTERVAIASAARAARTGESEAPPVLPDDAVEAVSFVAARPAQVSEAWVRGMVSSLGETRYVELVGIVAVLACVDTVTQLLGAGLERLPEPLPGNPTPDGPNPRLKRRSSWVAMDGPPMPRWALTAAPRVQATVNRLLDRLYMTGEDMRSNDPVRGLTRTQVETVVVAVSHSNECFY
jgi:hypothetical protein